LVVGPFENFKAIAVVLDEPVERAAPGVASLAQEEFARIDISENLFPKNPALMFFEPEQDLAPPRFGHRQLDLGRIPRKASFQLCANSSTEISPSVPSPFSDAEDDTDNLMGLRLTLV
jgi:hypothetical protein